uniref:EGF-like domain-containing protein n=1 Tax=Angiostrongylus cantonensis TaxID=6313 RepID=A0A0K0DCL2_ANGCA
MGFFTRLHFHQLTCIRSLTIHCLKPLTGAEEIDILYSECEHNHWKVVHYANTKEKFVLKWEVVAQQLSISSRVLLSIIDVQVETCTIHNNAKNSFNPCHRPRVHQRQHDISLQSVHAKEVVHPRQKRSTDYVLPAVYRTVASPYDIPVDVVIPENQTVVIQPGVTLRFSKNAGFTVRGVLIVNGTKAAPITFEPQIDQWKGIEIINASLPSRFSFANVSGSSMGIRLKSGVPPSIDNVISEWNQYGFDFQTVASVNIVSSAALNNEKDGFRIRTKGDVLLESSVSASNHRDGFRLNVAGNVTVLDSHSISNGQHGFILLETSPSVLIQQFMTNSNAANGIRFDDVRVGRSLIKLNNVNVTGHYHAAGISFQDASDLRLEMNHCFIEENHILGISFDGVTANSSIHIVDSNFTRNRGSTILMSLLRDVDVRLHRNTFIANNLNDFDQHEAVIDIATFAERTDSRIRIEDNHFEQNSMKNVLIVRQLGGYAVQVLIMKNNFVANLAQSIIDLDVPEGEIKGNYFSNVQSTCDITRISLMSADAVENYWAHETDAENSSSSRGPVDVIAVGTMRTPRERWAMEQEVVKRNSSFNNSSTLRPFSNTYNQVKAIPQPYSIGSEVAIQPGQIVIVDPGSEFEFAPGIGLTVQDKGKLYLNGTVDKPIRLFGESTWRGLIIKPGGTLVLSHTIIKDASIGMWIDSEKVQVESARITDPVVSNGSSYSIHIVEFPAFPLKTVSLRNVTVSGQNRGHAGVLITSGWVEEINIERSLFARNTVPSLIVGVEITICDENGANFVFIDHLGQLSQNRPRLLRSLQCRQKKSQAHLTNTTFRNNEDIVVHFDVGECVSVSVTGNRFLENNKAIGHGVLMLNAAPKEKFSALPIVVEENEFLRNRGEYTAMLAMYGTSAANGSGWFHNVNSVASVIVTSPYYRIHANEFSNPSSAHDLDVRSNGSWKLEATGNKWHTTDMLKAIKAPEGSVKLKIDEVLTKPDAQLLPYNSQCAHLNYCSHIGKCQGGICLCPANRVGLDCSIVIGCPSNCSNNGVCDIMNKCVCHDGWSSADCSIPLCRYDCHGHGRCVSKNECECYAGWGGEFVVSSVMNPVARRVHVYMENACRRNVNVQRVGKDQGALSQHAEIVRSMADALLRRNATVSKVTMVRSLASFSSYYLLKDCSICQGPRCQSCDFDCAHGVCERETRTCSCSRGWSGAACDVCRSANCQVKSSVLYILPSIADREDVNVVVNVFGTEFPQTSSSSYTCIFGASYSEGKRISSTVVRCRVPKQLTLGRHLFNLAPEGSISVIPNFDVRPIHFTIYDSCTPSFCKGVCVGPLCVCPKGATGINCDVFEIIPSIDRHFLEYQKASTATEGSPYIVVLPTMPGSLYHVNSTINDLHFDSARGIIEWAQPVGSYTPYMITVVSNSLSGESSVSWNVTVEPSYTVDVTSVKNVPGLSTMRIVGKLRGLKNNYAAPVRLWIKRMDQEQLMEIPVKSDGDTFTHDFIPDQGGNYTVAASHPGAPLTSDGVQFEVQPLQLSIDNDLHSTIIRALNDCHVNMLRPRNGTVMENSVSFVENAPNWRGETVSLLICGNRRELWRNQLNRQVPSLTAVPSVIALPFGSVQSKSFEVIIYRNDVHLNPPLKLASSDSTQPVFVIATDPDINYINSSTKYDQYREGMNSSLQLVANEKVVVRIPIYYVGATNKFNVSICVKDSYDYAGNGDDTAVLSVSNTALGVDIVRSNMKLNKDFVSFPLAEGFYQITAKAPNHRTVSEVVHITPVNTSFCVNLVAIDTRSLVTIGERGISTVKLKGTNMVSLQVLSTFFLLLTDCRTVHVNLTELGEAMQCVSSLESECPILRHRKRSIDNRHKDLKSYTPVDVINHKIFPPSIIDCLDVNGGVIDEFLRSISDNSELGIAISTTEAEKLKDDNLVQLWNATVTEWTSGRMESPGENVGILYADAKQLVVTADRLQSLTRQYVDETFYQITGLLVNQWKMVNVEKNVNSHEMNGATDPFSLLHEYVGQILTTRDNRDEECMSAAVLVEPYVIYEDSTLTIDVFIESLQDSTLTNIDLSIDFVRNDMFVPPISFGVGPSWSAGINTISGFGVLAPRSSFEVHWSRKIITENRLTATAFYQAVIVIGFHKDGLPSKQRLKSPLLEIRPRRSVRLLHFINGDVSRSPTTPFSAMTAIMNIGYSPLVNVRVLHADFDLVTSSRAAPFEIVQMEVDGKRIASSLSPAVGNIESGTSRRITYHITTPGQAAKIANMSVILTVDGQLTAVEDEHVYVIKVAASRNDGFIVSSLTDPEPTFFYRPDIGSIVNIVPLQYVTSTVKSTNDDERKITILASFRNLLSPGLTGALWCSFKLPPIPANYRLTRVADQRGARSRVLTPVTWTEEQMDGTTLNFIDSGASFPVSDIVYEMEFTEPSQKTAPTFDQTSYRAQASILA